MLQQIKNDDECCGKAPVKCWSAIHTVCCSTHRPVPPRAGRLPRLPGPRCLLPARHSATMEKKKV